MDQQLSPGEVLEMREGIRLHNRVIWVVVVFVTISLTLQLSLLYDYNVRMAGNGDSIFVHSPGRNNMQGRGEINGDEEEQSPPNYDQIGVGIITYHLAMITLLFWAAYGIMQWAI